MNSVLFVALGGALGSIARYGVGVMSLRAFGPDFPYGTLIVNIVGSTLIGLVAGWLAAHSQWSQEIRSFVVIGILGGFTTFSAFSLDIITLYERENYMALVLYAGLSIVLSLAGLVAGLFFMRSVFA